MSNLDKLQQLNTNKPRETLVVATDGLVIKRPIVKSDNVPTDTWLQKQHHARAVQESLQATSGVTYFVPRMLEISDSQHFAIEQRVPGRPLTSSYVETLSDVDLDIIYRGIANFLNDINQSRPVLNQRDTFDVPEHPGDLAFDRILKHIKPMISSKEYDTIKKSKQWFDEAALTDASVVFCQGDMNEHNIFYDEDRMILSIIDFADARYENAHDMFHRDWARLGWLDLERLIRDYEKLPKSQPVIIKSNPDVAKLRNALQNVRWTAQDIILGGNAKLVAARTKILKEEIARLDKVFAQVRGKTSLDRGTTILATVNKNKDIVNQTKKQKDSKIK